MGIFRKKARNFSSTPLLMPDGTRPAISSQDDADNLFRSWTLTPETISNWSMEKVDQDAWIKASAEISSLDLQNREGRPIFIYATGDVYISGLEGQLAEMIGESILTELFTIIHWPYGLTRNSLILVHDQFKGSQSTGSMSAEFHYKNSLWIKKNDAQKTGPIQIYVACRLGKDGQANRRTITFWNSWAANLKRELT